MGQRDLRHLDVGGVAAGPVHGRHGGPGDAGRRPRRVASSVPSPPCSVPSSPRSPSSSSPSTSPPTVLGCACGSPGSRRRSSRRSSAWPGTSRSSRPAATSRPVSCSPRSAADCRASSCSSSAWTTGSPSASGPASWPSSCRRSAPTSPSRCRSSSASSDRSRGRGWRCSAFALVYQQIENVTIEPRISAEAVDVHPAVSFAAVMFGAALFGVAGAFVAVPVAALMLALFGIYSKKYDLVPELATLAGREARRQAAEARAGAPPGVGTVQRRQPGHASAAAAGRLRLTALRQSASASRGPRLSRLGLIAYAARLVELGRDLLEPGPCRGEPPLEVGDPLDDLLLTSREHGHLAVGGAQRRRGPARARP